MSVRITDTRATWANANTGEAGWVGGGTLTTTTFVEGPTAYIGAVNITTAQYYNSRAAGVDLSYTMIYVWSNNFALQGVWNAAAPPNALYLGSGGTTPTNAVSFKMAGSDRKVFAHLTQGDWNWDCLLLDTTQYSQMNTDGLTVVRAGTFAGLATGSITAIGSDFTTLSKGLGGGSNVAVDIIRYGNDGIIISSGSIVTPGTFSYVIEQDRASGSAQATGIIREYTNGVYGCQGPLTFGTASESTYFSDSNVSLTFENRNVANDKYYLSVSGSKSPYSSSFILDNASVTTAGPWVKMMMSSSYIKYLNITNTTFRNLSGSVSFASDATASVSHSFNYNTFVKAGDISLGNVNFNYNTIQSSGQITLVSASMLQCNIENCPVSGSGSVYWNVNLDTYGKIDGTSFTRAAGFKNHAIEYGPNCPVSTSLDSMTFTNYGPDGSVSASLYNNSGKNLYIVISNGSTPTVRNAGSLTTTLISGLTTVTLTGVQLNSEIRVLDSSTYTEYAGIETTVTSDWPFQLGAGTVVDIVIFNLQYDYYRLYSYEIPVTNTSIPISQVYDRNFSGSLS